MALVEQHVVNADIGDQFELIRESIEQGWEMWLETPERQKAALTTSARANAVHSYIIDRASALLPNAHIYDKSKLKLFVFQSRYALRFKKFDSALKTRNQQSSQVDSFRSQEPLSAIPAAHHLEAGYVLGRTGHEIESIHLTCPNGDRLYWHIDITKQPKLCGTIDMIGIDDDKRTEDVQPAKFSTKKKDEIIPFRRADEQGD